MGFHFVYVRFSYNTGAWSIPEGRRFYVYNDATPSLNNSNQITRGEYFFDTDPGVGNGPALPNFSAVDSLIQNAHHSYYWLTGGIYKLYVRYRDSSRKWSIAQPTNLYVFNDVTPTLSNASGIITGEYFFNTDPGVGLGNSFTASGPVDSVLSNLSLYYPED